ncbi:MAG: hypothetical protein QOF77_1662 [Solirubrobacteraceae bacterium]|jgi:hypothetical protein|nr:hypothetical protein [Solirubrobacteraceae bacterium]
MAYLVIAFCFGVAGGLVGRHKGSSFLVWFAISAVVPFLGLITALVYRYETEEDLRRCPNCRRATRIYDAICTSCGEELEYPEATEIIAPTSALRVQPRL